MLLRISHPHFPGNSPYTSLLVLFIHLILEMEDRTIIIPNAQVPTTQADSERPKKKRIRNWTAEDRAIHREFEKSRREAFGVRLMVGRSWNIASCVCVDLVSGANKVTSFAPRRNTALEAYYCGREYISSQGPTSKMRSSH